jgi:hypothetical protein
VGPVLGERAALRTSRMGLASISASSDTSMCWITACVLQAAGRKLGQR